MAYSDAGAFVYRNCERVRTREDAWVNAEIVGEAPLWISSYIEGRTRQIPVAHAVLGNGAVRLCGYKSWPMLYVRNGDGIFVGGGRDDGDGPTEILPDSYEHDGIVTYSGSVMPAALSEQAPTPWKWQARPHSGNMIDLALTEPDGTVWLARCGYGFGSGFDMEDRADETLRELLKWYDAPLDPDVLALRIDRAIADRVFGFEIVPDERNWRGFVMVHGGIEYDIPLYSANILSAWDVAEKLGLAIVPQSAGDGFRWLVVDVKSVAYGGGEIRIVAIDGSEDGDASVAMAICKSALRCFGVDTSNLVRGAE